MWKTILILCDFNSKKDSQQKTSVQRFHSDSLNTEKKIQITITITTMTKTVSVFGIRRQPEIGKRWQWATVCHTVQTTPKYLWFRPFSCRKCLPICRRRVHFVSFVLIAAFFLCSLFRLTFFSVFPLLRLPSFLDFCFSSNVENFFYLSSHFYLHILLSPPDIEYVKLYFRGRSFFSVSVERERAKF